MSWMKAASLGFTIACLPGLFVGTVLERHAAAQIEITPPSGGGEGLSGLLPPLPNETPPSGPAPNASNYGFPRPVVAKPSSLWNPLQGAADAFRNAFTSSPSPAAQLRPETVPGDPTSLQTEVPSISADVHLHAARLASSTGKLEEAGRHYEAVLKQEPDHLECLVSLARISAAKGNFHDAAKHYMAAIQSHPSVAGVHNDFGMTSENAGRHDIALSAFQHAVNLNGNSTRYRNNYARALTRAGKFQEALKQLVEAHPPAVAHYNFAYLLSKEGANEQAVFHLRQALRIQREFPEARSLLNNLVGRLQVIESAQQAPIRRPIARWRFPQPGDFGEATQGRGQFQTNSFASHRPSISRLPAISQATRGTTAPRVAARPDASAPLRRVPPPASPALDPRSRSQGLEDSLFRRSSSRPVYMPPAAPKVR